MPKGGIASLLARRITRELSLRALRHRDNRLAVMPDLRATRETVFPPDKFSTPCVLNSGNHIYRPLGLPSELIVVNLGVLPGLSLRDTSGTVIQGAVHIGVWLSKILLFHFL